MTKMNRKFEPLIMGLLLLALLLIVTQWVYDVSRRQAPDGGEQPLGAGVYFLPAPGVYDHAVLVDLRPVHEGRSLIFTTDGSLPTLATGARYTRPLRLAADYPGVTVIRASEIVLSARGRWEVVDDDPHTVPTASYAVGLEGRLPVLSLVGSPDDLWHEHWGVLANPWELGRDWERPVHLSFYDREGTGGEEPAEFTIAAGLRVHDSELPALHSDAAATEKLPLRLYFRNDYGPDPRLTYRLFDAPAYERLLLLPGDRSGRWTLLHEQLVMEAARDLGLRVAEGRYVRLFINGAPWGIYRLTERVDRFFLEEHYQISEADVVQGGQAIEGSTEAWRDLLDWLGAHDLADPANYAHLTTQINVANFTDYAILQLYFGFPGGDLVAVRPQGGRWFWIYGGGGAASVRAGGYASRFAHRPEAALAALPGGAAEDEFALLLRALLANPAYRAEFARRAADVMNTALAPSVMQNRVTRLADHLSEDIAAELARWPLPASIRPDDGDPRAVWEQNVGALRSKFVPRRPDVLRERVADLADLMNPPGVTTVRFESSPPEGGTIYVNGISARALPAQRGVYFVGDALSLIAAPAPGQRLVRWAGGESSDAGASNVISLPVTEDVQRVAAVFAPMIEEESAASADPWPDDVVINELWINDDGTRYTTAGPCSLPEGVSQSAGCPIEGDWIELWVRRPGGVDLRGWRLTDNDTKAGREEGSLIFPDLDVLADVPHNTVILIVATETPANAVVFAEDDLDPRDGRLRFYVGNGALDATTDPGFGVSPREDNVALLAPGPSSAFEDDVGVDFVAEGNAVTPYSFGVLADGVTFERSFQHLGADDGAIFTGMGANDDLDEWVVDPPAHQTGDEARLDATNLLTPGRLNPPQRSWARQLSAWLRARPRDLIFVGAAGIIAAAVIGAWLLWRRSNLPGS